MPPLGPDLTLSLPLSGKALLFNSVRFELNDKSRFQGKTRFSRIGSGVTRVEIKVTARCNWDLIFASDSCSES
jgi:hypothetical protein